MFFGKRHVCGQILRNSDKRERPQVKRRWVDFVPSFRRGERAGSLELIDLASPFVKRGGWAVKHTGRTGLWMETHPLETGGRFQAGAGIQDGLGTCCGSELGWATALLARGGNRENQPAQGPGTGSRGRGAGGANNPQGLLR